MKGNLKIIQKSLNLTSFKRENIQEINKADGFYVDSSLNRKLGRVGMPYKKSDKEEKSSDEDNFIKNGKLSDKSFNKLVNNIKVEDIPVNIYSGKIEKEPNSAYLVTHTDIGNSEYEDENLRLVLKYNYTAYLDSKTGKIELDMDDGSGDITKDYESIENGQDTYFKFLGNNESKLYEAILEKITNHLKKNKSYKKYFKNK